MEHRHNARVAVDLKALIYRGGLPVATGRVVNASHCGLFVETDYGDLRQYQGIECEFCLSELDARTRHRVVAYVSRRAHAGVGLEFHENDDKAAYVVSRLLPDTAATGPRGKCPRFSEGTLLRAVAE
jgi:hypothetical protein